MLTIKFQSISFYNLEASRQDVGTTFETNKQVYTSDADFSGHL